MRTFYYTNAKNTSGKEGIGKVIALILLGVVLFSVISDHFLLLDSYAASETKIYGINDEADEIHIYVGGCDDSFTVSELQIDGILMEDVSISAVNDSGDVFRTLIMIDNSLSIPKKHRSNVIDLVKGIVKDIGNNEKVRIALFDEDISYISDYSNDSDYLLETIDTIKFINQDTFLSDALYTALEDIRNMDSGFDRILIISDGVDNKPLGITENELYAELDEVRVQIYSIGVLAQNNNNMLKNMFALARYTNGKDILLDETDNATILKGIQEDNQGIYTVKVILPEELKKGGKVNAQLTLGNGEKLKCEINLPFGEAKGVASEEQADAEVTDTDVEQVVTVFSIVDESNEEVVSTESNTSTKEEPSAKKTNGKGVFVFIPIAIIIIAVAVYFLFFKNKKKETTNEPSHHPAPTNDYPSDITVIEQTNPSSGDETVVMPGVSSATEILTAGVTAAPLLILTRLDNPNERYSCRLNKQVTIGRKHNNYGIIINCDYSISKEHCTVNFDGYRCMIQDLNSTNGTFINDIELLGVKEIKSGDLLKLGRISFSLSIE